MKRLIIVRYGEHEAEGRLTERGKQQVAELCDELRCHVVDMKVQILTSNAAYACATAGMIGKAFDAVPETARILHSSPDIPENLTGVLALIARCGAESDALILVTHFEYSQSLHQYFGQVVLQAEFRSGNLAHGEAWIIDCEQRKLVVHRSAC